MINGPSESMRRSTGWNAGAQLAPVVSAATALPFLARGLGEERLGILLLVWTIISLTSILDLGVGRAMTQMLAARRTSQPMSDVATRLVNRRTAVVPSDGPRESHTRSSLLAGLHAPAARV
mgnify:CR=1 FL=1